MSGAESAAGGPGLASGGPQRMSQLPLCASHPKCHFPLQPRFPPATYRSSALLVKGLFPALSPG